MWKRPDKAHKEAIMTDPSNGGVVGPHQPASAMR